MSCVYGGVDEQVTLFTGGTVIYAAEAVCLGGACGGMYKDRQVRFRELILSLVVL